MNEDGTNKYALSKACDIALQSRKFDKAVELLEDFKGQGAPIRQHYFWPFFATSKTDQGIIYYLIRFHLSLDLEFKSLNQIGFRRLQRYKVYEASRNTSNC